MVVQFLKAAKAYKYQARAALRDIILRGQIGRVANVVARLGRGPRAMRELRSLFRGLTVQARQGVLNFAHGAVQAPRRQLGERLFLKDIPIARGLDRWMQDDTRVRYGVDVTWRNVDTGQIQTMYVTQDYHTPMFNDFIDAHMEDIARENINMSPESFGVSGDTPIEILKVDIIYVMRAF